MTRFFEDMIREEPRGWTAAPVKVLLWTVSVLYGCGVRMLWAGYDRGFLRKERLPRPVISVGNITVGGTGKTPLVIWLVKHLQAQGLRPAVLSRGYRSRNSEEGNDEIQMMRELCPDIPVITGKKRYETALRFLSAHDVDVFVMDDGFQHRRLERDLDIVAVESLRGFGNGHLLPRGLLREPLSGLRRADIVALTKQDIHPAGEGLILEVMRKSGIDRPLIRSCQNVVGLTHLQTKKRQDAGWLKDRQVVLVSSIADPRSFEETVKQQGALIAERFFYPDHYDYQPEDIRRMADICRENSRDTVVTTHKDAVKLEGMFKDPARAPDIWILNIELNVRDNENILGQRIRDLLRA